MQGYDIQKNISDLNLSVEIYLKAHIQSQGRKGGIFLQKSLFSKKMAKNSQFSCPLHIFFQFPKIKFWCWHHHCTHLVSFTEFHRAKICNGAIHNFLLSKCNHKTGTFWNWTILYVTEVPLNTETWIFYCFYRT